MKFKLGEIVVGQNHVIDTAYNGMEGEIVRVGPGLPSSFGEVTVPVDYWVVWADGEFAGANEINLRKRRPPIPEEVLSIFNERKVAA